MTSKLELLQHALGLDPRSRGRAYRNHFVATAGSQNYAQCCALVDAGLMARRGLSPLYGGPQSCCFVVTDAGKQYVREHSPAPQQA